jgi:hypothetical protein
LRSIELFVNLIAYRLTEATPEEFETVGVPWDFGVASGITGIAVSGEFSD